MDKKEMRDKKRCSSCNSTQTYIRRTSNERVCRSCPFIEKLNEEEDARE